MGLNRDNTLGKMYASHAGFTVHEARHVAPAAFGRNLQKWTDL